MKRLRGKNGRFVSKSTLTEQDIREFMLMLSKRDNEERENVLYLSKASAEKYKEIMNGHIKTMIY